VVVSNQDSKSAHASPRNPGAAILRSQARAMKPFRYWLPLISGKKPVFQTLAGNEA